MTAPVQMTAPMDVSPAAGTGTIVLGMHRSGTSLVTRILHDLGGKVGAPGDLLRGHEEGRPVTYWESRTMVVINETLLAKFGGDWAVPPDLPAGWWSRSPAADMAAVANGLFWTVHPSAGWLCKDPRLSLTLPFWRRWVMPDLRAVLVVRHPDEVAASLARRDGIDRVHGTWLWQRYTVSALRHCRDVPTMIVSYHQLCRKPRRTAAVLQEWAGGVWPEAAVARLDDVVADIGPKSVGQPRRPQASRERLALYEALDGLHGTVRLPPVPAMAGRGLGDQL